jgi:hypothetical protein
MATAPQIIARDGSSTQNLVLTTNQRFIQLTGTVSASTIDIQVSVNGGAFQSDPTLVRLDGTDFAVPSPDSFPDGLTLQLGENTILLRAIDLVGSVSPASSAQVTRVTSDDRADQLTPTGIRLRRRRDSVDILAAEFPPAAADGAGADFSNLEFRGFNFYASSAAGGTSGRFRINAAPVTDVTEQEEDAFPVSSHQVDFEPQGVYVRARVTQEDSFGQTISEVSDTQTRVFNFTRNLRFSDNLQDLQITNFVKFTHSRTAGESANTLNSDQFSDLDDSEPLYYTVTGVYYDAEQNLEFETPHSQEVLGSPLVIDTNIRDLPGRTSLQITTDFVRAIQRVDDEISLIPGSTTRDATIDPFASEAERIWFLVDFVHRSQSFLTLLQIDDANGDYVSDAVAGSSYKQALKAALGLQTDNAVQNLIDTQFEKLAGNFNKSRLPGRPAVGQVVFFTLSRPTQDVIISSGAIVSTDADPDQDLPAVRYTVGGTYTIPVADADAFFNFDTQQYEVIADVVAETTGEAGNRPAGQIKNVVSGVTGGAAVTNREASTFGTDRESNSDLATRAQLGFVSVDAGTEGGYASTAAETIGVVKHKIVKSGDPLMMRDWDEVRKKHIGGKVDIWVQGLRERTVTEKFAFSFEVARDIRCQIIDVSTLTFRVLDNRVTVDTPVTELLDDAGQGLGVRNVTTGEDYDLTGYVLIDFETFRLDTGIPQPATAINDIITADYRYRSINQFAFTLQPVRRVVSVVGESSGALNITQGFDLFKTQDPLLEGESTIASDYLVINQVNGIPTGATINVTNEPHVMIGFFEEPLARVGINLTTIRVFSQDRSVEYNGPSAVAPDYEIVEGTATDPIKIVRTNASQIVSGETVVVDYTHDENFTVTYVVNDLLQQLQRTVNSRRHVTADVLVKQAIQNSLDFDTTIQLKDGATKDTVDPLVRTNVSVELNSKLIGQGVAQSDMINAIDSTEGVDFQVLPLARMGYADGALKLRETVLNSNTRVGSLDIGGNQAFILNNPVQYPTTDGGGEATEHKGVFQDDEAMVLSSTLATVAQNTNQAYIIGATGAVINGYSDDATLISDGFTDPEDIEAERLRRTANHVVVALDSSGSPTDNPDLHDYAVSYVVRNDTGPHDIVPADVEFIDLQELTLTIREVART